MLTPLKTACVIFAGFSLLGFMLFCFGVIANGRLTHLYMFWNLFLAWLPLGLALLLRIYSRRSSHHTVLLISIGVLWLLFVPNSFYMITDYIHITEVARIDPVYDTVMFSVIIATGYGLGLLSMLVVHRELQRYTSADRAWQLIIGAIAASSIAIYLGRELRWNSWDIVLHPGYIIQDVIHIAAHPFTNFQAYITGLTFFITITCSYVAAWTMLYSLLNDKSSS